MSFEDPRSKLSSLHTAAERISANLVELEIDSSRRLLEGTALQGESAARWSAASDALTELWRRQSLLEDLLKRADKLRGSRRADELRALLDGQTIELGSGDVPLSERDLLGSSRVAKRCSAEELLAGMSTLFDDVTSVISRIGGAWETLTPRLDEARSLRLECNRLAGELGQPCAQEVESASGQLDELSACITADPLSVRTRDVDELVAQLRSLRGELQGSLELQHGFDARVLEARELLDRIRDAVTEAVTAREQLLIKIVTPAPPSAPELRTDLERELSEIANLAQSESWREAHAELERWTARANGELRDDLAVRDACRAPIEARNQLRALLDAYQVKAKRLGRLEDRDAAQILRRAREALYHAPTDLSLAAQLVRSYQQALTGSTRTREAIR
jgi:hypothetical protein